MVGLFVGLTALASCEEVEQVQDRFRDMTPYEAYEASLADAGLDATALGRDWVLAGQSALEQPLEVTLPFQEEGFITPESPSAVGYRVTLPRGKRLTVEVALNGEDSERIFIDLFRVPADEGDPMRPIVSTDSVPGAFSHEPWRGGDFLLRVQPELLRGGSYTVTMRLDAQLAFPVEGHGVRSAQSLFGVDREGGRRQHHGIDIFARRGTPVVATADGRVSRVELTNLGGKVVWLRDEVRNSSIYYAHLDSQHVASGQRVQRGDTLGFVGNSGNARTTPPHLHFGIYRRGEGPVDPLPFVAPPRGELAAMTADLGLLGAWVRLKNDGIRLRAEPSSRGSVVRELGQHTPLRVLAGSGDFFRVALPDGSHGYVAARLTEPTVEPVTSEVTVMGSTVRAHPTQDAPVVATLSAGAEVPVLGRFDGYLYVQVPGGATGWLGEASQP